MVPQDHKTIAQKAVAEGISIKQFALNEGLTFHQARKAMEWAREAASGTCETQSDTAHAPVVADPIFRTACLRALKRGTTVAKLASDHGTSPETIEAMIDSLAASGYLLEKRGDTIKIGDAWTEKDRLQVPVIGGQATFGFVTDTHLCSKFARLDVLEAAYDRFDAEGISVVFHAGNLVDGESKVNHHDLLVHGLADQAQYVLDNYPERDGVATYYIDGDDHEGWWRQREGIEFGRFLELEARAAGRNDLNYMGYDVELHATKGSSILRVMHPGGGSAYAMSYAPQKIVESFQGGEKPAILLLGHFHKHDTCYPRNVFVVQGGCCQDQSTFMRKKKLEAHVGFCIIHVEMDEIGGISRFRHEFFPFYDRKYYQKRKDLVL